MIITRSRSATAVCNYTCQYKQFMKINEFFRVC